MTRQTQIWSTDLNKNINYLLKSIKLSAYFCSIGCRLTGVVIIEISMDTQPNVIAVQKSAAAVFENNPCNQGMNLLENNLGHRVFPLLMMLHFIYIFILV